jgi:hypothetical protein
MSEVQKDLKDISAGIDIFYYKIQNIRILSGI